jgi:hypothetical protein
MTKILYDNKVSITVIITLFTQCAVLSAWGGGIQERVDAISSNAIKHEQEDRDFQHNMETIGNRLTTIETILRQHDRKN